MNMKDIIGKKRYGGTLTEEEIKFFVDGVTDKSIPDYQASALLMAIVLNGMNKEEMTCLTMAMAHSGTILDLSFADDITVDKHSTGGVGDKVTILLLPLLATFGIKTVKLSGRGLGFTGGTVDKFGSIEGFRYEIPASEFPYYLKKCGMVISGPSPNLAPADKILYALRDVTGTVDSIPLIASSIMSKKLAGGADVIVLDVTCGSGAYMKTFDRAHELAQAMIDIGNGAGKKTVAVITDMDQPLGGSCGNTLEMQEVLRTFAGKGNTDVVEVVCRIAAECIKAAGKANGLSGDDLLYACATRLTDGSALAKFAELIASQGGDLKDKVNPVFKDLPFEAMRVTAPCDGYVYSIKTDAIGNAANHLGAGRKTVNDQIDYGAGIKFYAKRGDRVRKGDVLCSLCHGTKAELADEVLFDVMEEVLAAYEIREEAPEEVPVVMEVLS
ncbi:MAG: thymidine phosphorylase [Clostridiales bacterium]|nr:thymidine phosphorylase [Clostridiales bacterium]